MTNYEAGLSDGRKEGVDAILKIQDRMANVVRDRDEWKTQHENLLAMYNAVNTEIAALREQLAEAQKRNTRLDEQNAWLIGRISEADLRRFHGRFE